MYRVIIEKKAAKEIEFLPNDMIQGVIDVIGRLQFTPRPYGVKMV